MAPPFCGLVGRTIEQGGRCLSMNSHGLGKMLFGRVVSSPLAERSGNVVPVSGSVTPDSGGSTQLAAVSCQTPKWSTSVPPMLVTIRSTSRLVTCIESVVYRLHPPCSIIAKWNAALLAIACIRSCCEGTGGPGACLFGGGALSLRGP